MDIRKLCLYAAFFFVSYSLWIDWHQENPSPVIENRAMPVNTMLQETAKAAVSQAKLVSTTKNIAWVHTDVLDVGIDVDTGNIINAKLKKYHASVEQKNKPFVLLDNKPGAQYTANSSLVAVKNGKVEVLPIQYTTDKDLYSLNPKQDEIVVVLSGKTQDGLEVQKKYSFYRDKYLVNVNYNIKNTSDKVQNIYLNTELYREAPSEDASSLFHVGSYTGASYSHPPSHLYKKISFQNMEKENLDLVVKGGWFAMQQHYFLSAWILPPNSKNQLYTREDNSNYTIGSLSRSLELKPQTTDTIGANVYIGPEDAAVLKALAPGLDFTIDYGWLWFLSSLIFSCMKAIYSVIGNWGWSIILVTVFIKILFYKLSASSYKSMAGMRRLQPKLQALKDRYGDDKAKISQETMALYRQEKINPLGGCLPIIVQIPVFIALYWVLLESVELRHATFLWLHDLAAADPYHILPIIMGATMLIQQKLNPPPPDPAQAKAMMFLPIFFTILFWSFPAGLVLYWIVNNTLSIIQQWYITKAYSD